MAKKQFSILGLGTFVILTIGSLAQLLVMVAADLLWPQWMDHPWGVWIVSFVPLYLIAVPIGLLILRKVPAKPLEQRSMKIRTYLIYMVISVFMMYAGNLVGNMAAQGTTPRQITDLIGSLCDLTSGSGDKGTPVVLVQGYFDNYTN